MIFYICIHIFPLQLTFYKLEQDYTEDINKSHYYLKTFH